LGVGRAWRYVKGGKWTTGGGNYDTRTGRRKPEGDSQRRCSVQSKGELQKEKYLPSSDLPGVEKSLVRINKVGWDWGRGYVEKKGENRSEPPKGAHSLTGRLWTCHISE